MTVIRTAAGILLLCGIAACATTVTPDANREANAAPMPAATAGAPTNPAPDVVVEAAAPAAVPVASAPQPAMAPQPAPNPPALAAKPEPAKSQPVKPRPVAAKPLAAASPARPAIAASEPAPPKATGSSLAGKLELVAAGREGIVAGEVSDGLVYFLPKAGGAPPKPGNFTVDTRSKGFSPSVLVVPVGSTVRFPNRDSILHNVFSRTPGSTFDFGYYGSGEVKQRVFAKPGLVIVNCNVHHNMRADVVVLATPYYTRPDRNGRYTLNGLPAGPGTLVFWHPRSQAQSVQVALPMQGAVTRKLSATKPSRHAGTSGQ